MFQNADRKWLSCIKGVKRLLPKTEIVHADHDSVNI